MNQDLSRRKDDRHPTQPLQWDDKPDLLAMRAGVNEIQREIERARAAGLTMLALPIETANAACCYVAHLGERLAECVTAAPAEQASKLAPNQVQTVSERIRNTSWLPEQASKQVPTIDTPELRDLIGDVYRAGSYNESIEKSEDALMAHIEATLAVQPAAPVAATEQAKDTPESMANSNARFAIDGAIQYGRENRNPPPSADHWLAEYWNIGRQLAKLGETGWDNVTPLATPADAGAGQALTEAEYKAIHSAADCVDTYGRGELGGKLRAILARLSTPAAPVTASQPAAQVPSIDRDSVLEEAAKVAEDTDVATYGYWHDLRDDGIATRANIADAIRAMKGQPAAAHAAHDQKGGGNA